MLRLEPFHEFHKGAYSLGRHGIVDIHAHTAYGAVSFQINKPGFYRFLLLPKTPVVQSEPDKEFRMISAHLI